MITSCTKRFDNFPFAHRQPLHVGHCRLIHGHNWSFEFEFIANRLDDNGFVIDFGDLGWIKHWLNQQFDHTLVLNLNDPELERLRDFLLGMAYREPVMLARIVTVPNCGAEGLAAYVLDFVNAVITERTKKRVYVSRVTVFEDDRNSATICKNIAGDWPTP